MTAPIWIAYSRDWGFRGASDSAPSWLQRWPWWTFARYEDAQAAQRASVGTVRVRLIAPNGEEQVVKVREWRTSEGHVVEIRGLSPLSALAAA